MRIRIYYPLLFLSAIFLALGCSVDDVQNLESPQGEIVSFVPEDFAYVTRNTTFDNIWTAGQIISICEGTKVVPYKAITTSGSSGNRVAFVPVNTNSKGRPLTDADAHFWPTISTSKSFTAWYPNTEEKLSAPLDIEVSDDQRTSEQLSDELYKKYDLLYAYVNNVGYKETVVLPFYHQLARVVVSINGSATGTKVSSIEFGGGKVSVEGKIETLGTSGADATGEQVTWTIDSEKKIHTIKMRCVESDDDNHVYTYECILPPQSWLESVSLIKISGQRPLADTTMKDVTYTYDAAFVLKAGYQYIYRLNTSKAGVVSLASATVLNWQATGDYSGNAGYPDISYPDL